MNTAVEWLVEQLITENEITLKGENFKIIEQAKEMELDQIIHAFQSGSDDGYCMKSIQSAEQYYNEIFKK